MLFPKTFLFFSTTLVTQWEELSLSLAWCVRGKAELEWLNFIFGGNSAKTSWFMHAVSGRPITRERAVPKAALQMEQVGEGGGGKPKTAS